MRNLLKLASLLIGAAFIAGGSEGAKAGSITQPGETIGLATGAPLPVGVFFADGPNYGSNRNLSFHSTLGVNTPFVVWSTPWTILGARVELLASTPSVIVLDPTRNVSLADIYNPFFSADFAWDLGNGFGYTHYEGLYTPVNNSLGQDYFVYNNRNALSWLKDGWNLTAYSVIGITGTNSQTGGRTAPDYLNVDLTAAKSFGKFSVGVGAFGSSDISGISGIAGYRRQSQIAAGPLVGYDFTSFSTQVYVTRDLYTNNYVNGVGQKTYETRFWSRIVIPLYVAPTTPVVAARY